MATSLSANIDDEMLYDYGGATAASLLQHAGSNAAARPPPPPGARPSQVRPAEKSTQLTRGDPRLATCYCSVLRQASTMHLKPAQLACQDEWRQLAADFNVRGCHIKPALK